MILDTNALSAFAEGDERIADVLRQQRRLYIPAIVLGEFRHGIAGSRFRKRYETWLEGALRHFQVLPVVADTTRHYAALRMELKASGRPIPANDAWIAALAIQHSQPILTRDSHFEAVTGLRLVGW